MQSSACRFAVSPPSSGCWAESMPVGRNQLDTRAVLVAPHCLHLPRKQSENVPRLLHQIAGWHAQRSMNGGVSERTQALAGASLRRDMESVPFVPPEYIELAHKLADTAGHITTQFFRTGINVESKVDASPVTQADRAAEAAMRALIHQQCPEHGVFGEEAGLEVGACGGEWVWVLDPIDGTKSFITGKPLFGTLIALVHNSVPVVGIIDQPVLRERWMGVAGTDTTLNGTPIRTRPCNSIAEAYMYSTTPHMFSGQNEEAWLRVRDAVRLPLYGCDCYAYGLLAAGHCDLVVEADLKPYDYLALVPVIEGAGGFIRDWEGNPLRWDATKHAREESRSPTSYEVVAAGDNEVLLQVLKVLDWRGGKT